MAGYVPQQQPMHPMMMSMPGIQSPFQDRPPMMGGPMPGLVPGVPVHSINHGGGAGALISRPVFMPMANGATGIFQQAQMQQQSCLTMQLPLGPTLTGVRLLLPELLLKGSYSTKAFLNQCQTQGIEIGANTVGEKLQLSFYGPAGKEQDLVRVAMQLLTRPVTDPATFHQLKEDFVREIHKSLAHPEPHLLDAANKALYGQHHPYARSTGEVIDDLTRQTPESVMGLYRQMLENPAQISMSMVSAQPIEAQQAMVNQGIQEFAWYPNPYRPAQPMPVSPPVPPARGNVGPVLVPNNTVERAYLVRSWRAPAMGDPDYPAFCLIMKMLGGMSGGFFRIMRTETGLVYSTQQAYTSHKQGADYKVLAQVDFDKLNQALDGFGRVTKELLDGPISETQLSMSKKDYLLELYSETQASEKINEMNLSWIANDQAPRHPQELEAAIKRVSAEDIRRVAQRIFNPSSGYEVTTISAPTDFLLKNFPNRVLSPS